MLERKFEVSLYVNDGLFFFLKMQNIFNNYFLIFLFKQAVCWDISLNTVDML